MLFNVTPEQYPTIIRSEATGFHLLVSRAGSALGLLVQRLDEVLAPMVPTGVFAVGFGLAACAAVLLSKGVMETESYDEEGERLVK